MNNDTINNNKELFPLISVIIPIFNAEKYLEDCLKSVEIQTYKNIEVILVDDGSTDSSKNICKIFTDRDERFKYCYQENKGVSEARNRGLILARGEFIAFADSDDLLHKDFVKTQYRNISELNVDIAISQYTRFYEREYISGINTSSNTNNTNDENNCDDGDISKALLYNPDDSINLILKDSTYAGYTWNKMFRASLLKNDEGLVIPFDTSLHMCEDLYFCCQAIKNTEKIAFTEEKLYYYFENVDGISSGKFSKKLLTHIDALEKISNLFRDKQFILSTLDRVICQVVINQFSRMITGGYKDKEIESRYKHTIKTHSSGLNHSCVNWKDRLLGKLIISLPSNLYRFVYKLYSSVLK